MDGLPPPFEMPPLGGWEEAGYPAEDVKGRWLSAPKARKDPWCWEARKDWLASRESRKEWLPPAVAEGEVDAHMSPSYPVLVPGRRLSPSPNPMSSCFVALPPTWCPAFVVALGVVVAAAAARRPAEVPVRPPPLFAAAIVAWRVVRSRIICSFWSCLSACTVCACCLRLSRRENCFPQ